jgi:hypothetical protein
MTGSVSDYPLKLIRTAFSASDSTRLADARLKVLFNWIIEFLGRFQKVDWSLLAWLWGCECPAPQLERH